MSATGQSPHTGTANVYRGFIEAVNRQHLEGAECEAARDRRNAGSLTTSGCLASQGRRWARADQPVLDATVTARIRVAGIRRCAGQGVAADEPRLLAGNPGRASGAKSNLSMVSPQLGGLGSVAAGGLGWRVVSEGGCGGVGGAKELLPVEVEAVSADPETGAGDADDGGRSPGPVDDGGAEPDAAVLEFLVAGGNP